MKPTFADELAAALLTMGFSQAFGYLGHHVEPLPQALVSAGCDVVIAASETGAGFMAQGHALATRHPSLVFSAGGPGLAMLLPALQAARQDRIPVLAIVGQTGTHGRPAFQNTGSSGSRDREVLEALALPCLHLEGCTDLLTCLQAGWSTLLDRSPVVITVPCDIMATPRPHAPGRHLHPSLHRTVHGDGPSSRVPSLVSLPPPQGPERECGPYRAVLGSLIGCLPSDTLWFGEAGQCRHAMRMELASRGIALFDSPNTAAMGWAVAAAIGAACRQPRQPVCCFTGDGSARMMAAEWSTAVQWELPITYVLAMNGVLGGPWARLRGTPAEALAHLPPVDWCALAASLGMPASRVEPGDDLPAAIARLPRSGPRLLVVPLPGTDEALVAPYSLTLEPPAG